MNGSKKKEVSFDDLQRYMLDGGIHLLQVIVSDNRLNILIALHRDHESTTVLRIPPFYVKWRCPLYLVVIEVTGFLKVIDQVPIEFCYPAIASVTFDANVLKIDTCEGDGYIEVHLGDGAKVNIDFFDKEIGFQLEQRILFVHTESLMVNEPVMRELLS